MLKRAYSLPPRVLQTLSWGPVRALLNHYCRFEVLGKEHLNGLPQAILAANHASELDPILVTAALSPFGPLFPLFYVVGPLDHFKHERFGWRRHIYSSTFFRAWGAYSAPRGLRNYERSLQDHTALLRDGKTVCIFPEGGKTSDGTHGKAFGGVAYLSQASGVPVVPVSISGSFRLDAKQFFSRTKKIAVRFGTPIQPHELLGGAAGGGMPAYKQAAQSLMDKISNALVP